MPLPNHLARKSAFLQRLEQEPDLLESIEANAKANDIQGVAQVLLDAGITDALVHLRGEELVTGDVAEEDARPRCCIYFGEFICVCWH